MQARETDSGRPLSRDDLVREGIHYQSLPLDENEFQPVLERLKRENGYVKQDIVELNPQTPNLATICAKFDQEHLHEEDEVRFVLDGEGVFDIRSRDGTWMRVEVERGDLIVVPAKRFHRFELTDKKAIRCVRLFRDESGWVPHYR